MTGRSLSVFIYRDREKIERKREMSCEPDVLCADKSIVMGEREREREREIERER